LSILLFNVQIYDYEHDCSFGESHVTATPISSEFAVVSRFGATSLIVRHMVHLKTVKFAGHRTELLHVMHLPTFYPAIISCYGTCYSIVARLQDLTNSIGSGFALSAELPKLLPLALCPFAVVGAASSTDITEL